MKINIGIKNNPIKHIQKVCSIFAGNFLFHGLSESSIYQSLFKTSITRNADTSRSSFCEFIR